MVAQAVQDSVFASPRFPRLLDGAAHRRTIADGVTQGRFAYGIVGAAPDKLRFGEPMGPSDVEVSDEAFLITAGGGPSSTGAWSAGQ